MNTVDKIGPNTFFFKDVIVDDTQEIKHDKQISSGNNCETSEDIVSDARQRFIKQTRNAWKRGSYGE